MLTHQEEQFLKALSDHEYVHCGDMAKILGVLEPQVRLVRASLQKQGYEICSTHKGYSFKGSYEETENNYLARAYALLSLVHKSRRAKWFNQNLNLFQ